MGLLDGWLRGRRLAALERALAAAPRTDGYLELADGWLAGGRHDLAKRALEAGLASCVDADPLLSRWVALERARHGDEIRQLSHAIETAPTPEAYARLVAIYLDLDEIARAFALASALRKELPHHEAGHRLTGELYLWRWRQDYLAADGAGALAALREAGERDRGNYRVLRLLAEAYVALGAGAQALRSLAALERFARDDDATRALGRAARSLAGPPATDAERLASIELVGRPAFDLEAAGLATSLASRPQPMSRALTGRAPSRAQLSRALGELAALDGFVAAAWLDDGGQPIDAAAKDHAALPDTWRELFASLLDASRDGSQKSGIGRFSRGSLDGPDGAIYLARGPGLGFGALFGPPGPRPEGVWAVLDALELAEGAR